MSILKRLFLSPPAVNCITGAGLIVGAYLFELIGYYDPCPLCILQRWSFAFIAFCGVILVIPHLHIIISKITLFLALFLRWVEALLLADKFIYNICQQISCRLARHQWIF